MNPLIPAPIDVAYALLAVCFFVLAVIALIMLWREHAEECDIFRAVMFSILTVFVPFVGAVVTIVNIRKRESSTLNSL